MADKSMSKGTLTPGEISTFCSQISMIIKSGIPMSEGIEIMFTDAGSSGAKEVLGKILNVVEIGEPFHKALAKCDKFPPYVVTMVEIGEISGRLENVMDSLTAYYEREEAVSRVVRSAVTYPLIMIVMMLAVISILVIRVMPIFNDVFHGLGAEMSGFSLAIMNFGQFLGNYGLFFLIGFVLIAAGFLIFYSTESGKERFQRFKEDFFLTKSLYAKIASGRFASAMSLMLASGMDTDKSLEMVSKLIKTESIRKKIIHCQKRMKAGIRFSEALTNVGIFTGIYARMVTVAFKTGAMDTVMEKLASRYEEETNTQINNIISVVEPALVAILSVVVGIILLSVMLPLMSIMTAIS